MRHVWRVAALALVCCIGAEAQGAIVSSTQVSYFSVGGGTPAEIFRSILSRGPRVSGASSIASIATRAVQDGGLTQQGGSCRVTGYTIKMTFVIKRPRIANPGVLSASDRAMWQQMNGFIIAHENQHKSNWMGCASGLNQRIASLSAPSCGQLAAKADSLWRQMLASCDAKQRSFDAAQSRALEQQPFMRRARSGAR